MRKRFISAPDNPNASAIKWDGEWRITYETFRDMGLAYSVGLILIYLLVAAQFKSYAVPLIFGIFVSTALALLVIPILYFAYSQRVKE